MAQEDRNHGVPLYVMQRAFLQEDVCLVDENDSAPGRRDLQDFRESRIDLIRRRAEVSSTDDIQRLCERRG